MKFIIQIEDGISATEAFRRCVRVVAAGKVSETKAGKQHCFASTFQDGIAIFVKKNKDSEKFLVCRRSADTKA